MKIKWEETELVLDGNDGSGKITREGWGDIAPSPTHTSCNYYVLQYKTFDNNDLNQVVAPSGFSENKGFEGRGVSVSRAHKTWSRSFLLKYFLLHRAGPRAYCDL